MVKHFNTLEELTQYYRDCANKVFSDITVNVKEVKPKFKIGDYVSYKCWTGEFKVVDRFWRKRANRYFYIISGFTCDSILADLESFTVLNESELTPIKVSKSFKNKLSNYSREIKEIVNKLRWDRELEGDNY